MEMEIKSFMHMRMIFSLSTTIITMLMAWGGQVLCLGQTSDQLIEITKKAFKARENHPNLSRNEKFTRAFQDSFNGISAEKRTIALAHYLYDIDATSPEWAMSTMITMGVIDLLAADPEFIKDWSYLRQMIANEKDPRKFYLLSKIASMAKTPNDDFVAARAHMLFADGRVAKEEGEYTKDYAYDVSIYAYSAIVANLKALDAEFEPPPRTLPHEEQALILAKWLKENWPGCGDLVMPTVARNKKDRDASDPRNPNGQGFGDQRAARSEEERGNVTVRYIVAGLAALLAFAAAWFGLRRTKSGR